MASLLTDSLAFERPAVKVALDCKSAQLDTSRRSKGKRISFARRRWFARNVMTLISLLREKTSRALANIVEALKC